MKKITLTVLILIAVLAIQGQQGRPGPQPAPETGEKFKLGMAGYTFVRLNFEKALDILKRCDVHYLCIKDFHLPLDCTPEQVTAFHARLKEIGVTVYAAWNMKKT